MYNQCKNILSTKKILKVFQNHSKKLIKPLHTYVILCIYVYIAQIITISKTIPQSIQIYPIRNKTRQEEAKLHYTSLITNALHEGTIATKLGQRDRHATGRRAPRAPPGLEVWEQGKKMKPKATLDRTGSEQPLIIEDLQHE
ncbi:Hypothetical_protein [Hexamita inflata]|uniref:Hypothetical_protein n=1 Tax=Hexamita inflata TaxID=28002 RepID=A0AA86PU42_9EUKA|nr:Hypothetical protein HINF_LOCUS32486 [Hexamita inflata]